MKHRIIFRSKDRQDFYSTLKLRINDYIEQNGISRKGGSALLVKMAFMVALYLVPFILILVLDLNTAAFLTLWILMGLGMAGIGMNVMHDANHGTFSRYPKVNKLLSYSMNIIGSNQKIWKVQHNVLHHTYTNIHGADEDLNVNGVLRLNAETPLRQIHRFQFSYAYVLYCFSTLYRTFAGEFLQFKRFYQDGHLGPRSKKYKSLIKMIGWKAFYFVYILGLPLIFSSSSVLLILLGFLLMHAVAGLLLTTIFQTAHVVPEVNTFSKPNNGVMHEQWAIHEMMTTSNFAPKSKIFSWFIGGLNYQIEHHLFPNISHVHYSKLAPIVASTAHEFGVPYHLQGNFVSASANHFVMLYKLGKRKN